MNSLLTFVLIGAGFSLVFAVGSDDKLAEILSKHENFKGKITVEKLMGSFRELIVGPVNTGIEIPKDFLQNFHLVVSYTATQYYSIKDTSVWDGKENLKLSLGNLLSEKQFSSGGYGSVEFICRCTLEKFVPDSLAQIISNFIEGKGLTKMWVAVESQCYLVRERDLLKTKNVIVLTFE